MLLLLAQQATSETTREGLDRISTAITQSADKPWYVIGFESWPSWVLSLTLLAVGLWIERGRRRKDREHDRQQREQASKADHEQREADRKYDLEQRETEREYDRQQQQLVWDEERKQRERERQLETLDRLRESYAEFFASTRDCQQALLIYAGSMAIVRSLGFRVFPASKEGQLEREEARVERDDRNREAVEKVALAIHDLETAYYNIVYFENSKERVDFAFCYKTRLLACRSEFDRTCTGTETPKHTMRDLVNEAVSGLYDNIRTMRRELAALEAGEASTEKVTLPPPLSWIPKPPPAKG